MSPKSTSRKSTSRTSTPRGVSKTRMIAFVKALDWRAVKEALDGHRELLDYRGPKGQNLLHLCCGIEVKARKLRPDLSIRTAGVLLDAGLDINQEAFREGTWKATPLWYAIGRGKNLELAAYLLKRGADPEHCMWAAAFNDDPAAVRLLVKAGAEVDPAGEETPLLFAVKWSQFDAARELLESGADPDFQDKHHKTALHYMLKKRSDARYVRMFLEHGARIDVPDEAGVTAAGMLGRSRDAGYQELFKRYAGKEGDQP